MQILDVQQVTAYIKELLDTDPILSDVWLRGEVSSFFESAAGHCYFTLTGDGCQIKSVLFKGNRWSIPELPRQGDEIVAHGNISIYPDQGQYQLYVDYLAAEGTGLAQIEFERLYRQLDAEGLFDESRKRPLPVFPRTIGLVTSKQGAVLHDICHVVGRRYPVAQIILAPSAVQGAAAPAELQAALRKLVASNACDFIIVARGGGAPEELVVFNDEQLARAIFRSPVPVISAIGHETDTTIADLVADVRAPTPSAAAELSVPDGRELLSAIHSRLAEARDHAGDSLADADDHLARAVSRLRLRSPERRLNHARQATDLLTLRAVSAARRSIERRRALLETRSAGLNSLNPAAVLQRGYAAIESADDGRRLATVGAIKQSSGQIVIRMSDGQLRAQTES